MDEKTSQKLLSFIVHFSGAFTLFLGPLTILLLTKDGYVKNHARKALNWQITFSIYCAGYVILALIIPGILLFAYIIMFPLNTIVCLIGGVNAIDGKFWDYPLAIEFLKVKEE